MATSSFFRNINIKTPKQARSLLKALENAEKRRGEEVRMSRPVQEISREQAKDVFAKVKWG